MQVLSLCGPASPSQLTATGHARDGHMCCGAYFWMLSTPSYPDYDGFSVYASPDDHPWVQDDQGRVAAAIQQGAQLMQKADKGLA